MGTYVIPGTPIIKQLQGRLRPFIGVAADYVNLSGIMYQIVENCFYGNVMAARETIFQHLCAYSAQLPPSEAEDMVEEAIDFIKVYIWRLVKVNVDDYSWHFEVTKRGDVLIYQLAVGRPHNPANALELIKREVETSLENGDWVSSSLREYLKV